MRVHLYRDSFDTAWGFRLQGGKDLSQPLVVQRVFSNTPAEGELQRGDILLSINGRDTSNFTHKQALDQIKFGGGQIELLVDRPSVASIKPLNPNVATRAPTNIPPVTSSPIVIPIKKKPPESGPKYKSNIMPPPTHPGHMPTKITMNKFGGGTQSFGSSYGNKQPSRSPAAPYTQQYSPHQQQSMMERVQDSLDSALSPTYQASPPQFQQYSYPSHPQPQRQFSAGQGYSNLGQSYAPVPSASNQQLELQSSQPDYVRSYDPVPEEDYTYVPVSKLKKQFVDKPERQPQLKHTNRPPKPFHPQASDYTNYGIDYSKVRSPPQQSGPHKPRPPPAPATRHVHAPVRDDNYDGSAPWVNTLRPSDIPKPWEMEQQGYIMPSERQAAPQQQVRVSPKPQVKPPTAAPSRQITVRSVSNEDPYPPEDDGPRVVHLQYNSPMGLYSKENIQETYKGQTRGQGHLQSVSREEQKKKSEGDRDWNDSYVYRMIHEDSRQQRQPPQTSPKPTHHGPTQQPQRYDMYDSMEYGTSDF